MKTNLKRATVVLLVIAGFTALNGSKAFRVHADSESSTNAILRVGYGAGTTGLINSSSNPNDVTIPTFVPFAEAAISSLMAAANSQFLHCGLRRHGFSRDLHRNLFGQAELHRQSDRGRWQQRHHSPRPGDRRQRKRGRVCQHGRRFGDFRRPEEAAHRAGSLALSAAEVTPIQSGVEGLNGADRGSGGTASLPVRRMVAQSNS